MATLCRTRLFSFTAGYFGEERCPTGEVRDGDKMWPFGEYFY
jgi:hypothetical protein